MNLLEPGDILLIHMNKIHSNHLAWVLSIPYTLRTHKKIDMLRWAFPLLFYIRNWDK